MGPGCTYYHGDHLGSTRVATTAGGWPVSAETYYPFGLEQSVPADANHYKFTGYERDAESNLDHATFRQLSYTQGRWTSPDPYDGSYAWANPQTFNRYAYVLSNPLIYLDPSGLAVIQVPCSAQQLQDGITLCFEDNIDGGGGGGGIPSGACTILVGPQGQILGTYCPENPTGNPSQTGGGGGGSTSAPGAPSKTQSLPQKVCQALAVNTALTQMNTAVQNANQKIYGGFINNPVSFLVKAALGYAAGGNLPGAVRAIIAVGLSEAWTILQQVPPVASSVYNAAQQAEQNLQSCGGG